MFFPFVTSGDSSIVLVRTWKYSDCVLTWKQSYDARPISQVASAFLTTAFFAEKYHQRNERKQNWQNCRPLFKMILPIATLMRRWFIWFWNVAWNNIWLYFAVIFTVTARDT